MDKHLAELAPITPPKPANAFTLKEFQTRYGVSDAVGRSKIKTLEQHGKVKRFGISKDVYYVPV